MLKSIAVVTGASSGIGKAAALRLARECAGMTLVARRKDELAETALQVQALGCEALVLDLDLGTQDAAGRVLEQTLQRFGKIDSLVNVADAVPGIDLFDMTDAQWDGGMALKFHGARRLTVRAWDALKASQGSVVFISGNSAENPRAASAAVGTINAAIEALAKAFADRGVVDGVQVNCVSPGAVMTPRRLAMLEKVAAAAGAGLEDVKQKFLAQAGIKRFGQAAELADLIAFALSPGARWMTGTVLRMDGGEIKSV